MDNNKKYPDELVIRNISNIYREKNTAINGENDVPGAKSNISDLYDLSQYDESTSKSLKKFYAKRKQKVMSKVSSKDYYKSLLFKRLPVLSWLPKYNLKSDLAPDAISGTTVGIMNIPQGMAYSLLASLPPVNGLYISFFPLITYFLLGTSNHLAIGSYALVSLLSGSVVNKMSSKYSPVNYVPLNNETDNSTVQASLAASDDEFRVTVACSLSLLIGVIQILLGICGLGILTSYFSDTFISSYTCGSAVQVVISQVKDLFGIKGTIRYDGPLKIPKTVIDCIVKLPNSNWKTIILSAISISFLVIFKEVLNPRIKRKLKFEFPSELLLVVLTTVASYFGHFKSSFAIEIIDKIPSGLEPPKMPDLNLWSDILLDAFIIAVIGFSVNISLGTMLARKYKYDIDSTQELYAYGLSNVFGSFFGCFPSAGSLSRSSVLESSGGKTQVSAIFSSAIMIIVILFLGPLFEPLPKAVLAAIIVCAFKNLLLQFKDLFTLWKINKYESITWFVTFMSIVVLDVDYALVIGVGMSIIMIIIKDQLNVPIKPIIESVNSISFIDKNLFLNNGLNYNLQSLNIKLFKIQQSIYFANCQAFQKEFYKSYGFSPIQKMLQIKDKTNKNKVNDTNLNSLSKHDEETKDPDIILDLTAVNYVDTNAIKMLKQLIEDYKKINVNIYMCECQDGFIKMIYRMDLLKFFDQHVFLTVNDVLKELYKKSLIVL